MDFALEGRRVLEVGRRLRARQPRAGPSRVPDLRPRLRRQLLRRDPPPGARAGRRGRLRLRGRDAHAVSRGLLRPRLPSGADGALPRSAAPPAREPPRHRGRGPLPRRRAAALPRLHDREARDDRPEPVVRRLGDRVLARPTGGASCARRASRSCAPTASGSVPVSSTAAFRYALCGRRAWRGCRSTPESPRWLGCRPALGSGRGLRDTRLGLHTYAMISTLGRKETHADGALDPDRELPRHPPPGDGRRGGDPPRDLPPARRAGTSGHLPDRRVARARRRKTDRRHGGHPRGIAPTPSTGSVPGMWKRLRGRRFDRDRGGPEQDPLLRPLVPEGGAGPRQRPAPLRHDRLSRGRACPIGLYVYLHERFIPALLSAHPLPGALEHHAG